MATNAGRCPLTGTGPACACADYATLSASRDARCTLHTRMGWGCCVKSRYFGCLGIDGLFAGKFFGVFFVFCDFFMIGNCKC